MTFRKLSSTAVMARRHEPADSLDFFPTPPWATRAFCEHVMPVLWGADWGPWPDLFDCSAFDPACGEGHMALVLDEYFAATLAADIHDYGFGAVQDFLHLDQPMQLAEADWIISNPPFNLAVEFVETALKRARRGVAMLVRTQFGEGQARYKRLFQRRSPHLTAQYVERVPMHRGRWVVNGKTATAYKWFCWRKHPGSWFDTREIWIPPSRAKLSRHDDWLNFSGCMDLPKGHKALGMTAEAA